MKQRKRRCLSVGLQFGHYSQLTKEVRFEDDPSFFNYNVFVKDRAKERSNSARNVINDKTNATLFSDAHPAFARGWQHAARTFMATALQS